MLLRTYAYCDMCLVMGERVPVRCSGNESKRYDGKVWLERLQDIIELNGAPVTADDDITRSSLKTGDSVKVRQVWKNGREKIWSGFVEFDTPSTEPQNTPTKRKLETSLEPKAKIRKTSKQCKTSIFSHLSKFICDRICENRPLVKNMFFFTVEGK